MKPSPHRGSSSVECVLATAQQVYPLISLPSEEFLAHIREQRVGAANLAAHGPDLFLACACARKCPAALAQLERDFVLPLPSLVRRLRLPEHLWDELRQRLRVHLVLDPRPRIASYAGHGPLRAWVGLVALRLGLRLVEEQGADALAENGAEEPMLGWASAASSPEKETIKREHQADFNAALEEALLTLGPRDRTILRLAYVDGLGAEAIADIYRVHRSTVARWFLAIRAAVTRHLRERLGFDLCESSAELRSFVRILRDDLELSISRLLRPVASTT